MVHGLRGRFASGALVVVREPLYPDFGPDAARRVPGEKLPVRVSLDTLRCWMMEVGL